MTSNPHENTLRISKHLLLSSPPGQFDLILFDLNSLLSEKSSETSSSPLNSGWIDQVRSEYESRSGKCVLNAPTNKNDDSADDNVTNSASGKANITKMERSLEEKLRTHLETYYSSKGVDSNIQVTSSSASGSDGDISTFTIMIYAERIQLPQCHAGSWLSRYNIAISPNLEITIDGSVIVRAHTFENGNVQMNSTTSLGPITMTNQPLSTTASTIIEKIQSWEEDHVVKPLHEAYDNYSGGILKKLRRVMPVTRTKFDWNVASHQLHKIIGMDIGPNK